MAKTPKVKKEHHLIIPDPLKVGIERATIKHAQKTQELVTWQNYARMILQKHCKA
jgi:hypothetical protein